MTTSLKLIASFKAVLSSNLKSLLKINKLFLYFFIFIFTQFNSFNNLNANCFDKYCFPKEINISNTKLKYHNFHKFTYYLVDLYYIASYFDESNPENRALVLYYLRDFKKDVLIDAGDKLLKKNPNFQESFIGPLASFNSYYQDIKETNTYTLGSVNKELSLTKNNQFLGSIKFEDFSKIYTDIWFDKKFGANKTMAKKLNTD